MIFPPRSTELLHLLLREVIRAGDLVVDATAGNGNDTVFLANAVGAGGKVIAMDIQSAAIEATRQQLSEKQLEDRVELHQVSHAEIGSLVAAGSAAVIIFNLGYLPGGDHGVMTEADVTLAALADSVTALKEKGVLAVNCYPGHEGGDVEAARVEAYLQGLPNFRLAKYKLLSTLSATPFLLIAYKKFVR